MCLLKECVKFIVFFFNLIFLIVGAALITVGAIYLAHFSQVTDAIPEPYDQIRFIPILTVVVGCIIFIISFFGCCGAIRGNPCLLTTYAVILLLIFVLQIALGTFAFIEIKDEKDFKNNVKQSIDRLFRKSDNATVELIDFIQRELHCCGTDGPAFWGTIGKETPKSCFEDGKKAKLYTDGCQTKFYTFLKDAARVLGIVVLTLAATEVVGAIFALCLANSRRNEIRRGYYA